MLRGWRPNQNPVFNIASPQWRCGLPSVGPVTAAHALGLALYHLSYYQDLVAKMQSKLHQTG